MKELLKMLNMRTGPVVDGKEFIKLNVRCEFEPFGIASENWELVYEIELPQIKRKWKNNKGEWIDVKSQHHMIFKARSYDAVIQKAKDFLAEIS